MEIVGTYLGRQIAIVTFGELVRFAADVKIRDAVVLLFWGEPPDQGDMEAVIERTLEVRPAAIAVGGSASEASFDALLRIQSVHPEGPHVMTRRCVGSVAESVEELLISLWPTEERIDGWSGYVIAASSSVDAEIRQAVATHLD